LVKKFLIMYDYIEMLIDKMITKELWDISIGPSGVNIQVGNKIINKGDLLPSGEVSLWIQCDVKIFSNEKEIFFSIFPQGREDLPIYVSYLEGKKIIHTSLDKKNNSLRIDLEFDISVQIYPQSTKSEKYWIIYDNQDNNPDGIIVFNNLINPPNFIN